MYGIFLPLNLNEEKKTICQKVFCMISSAWNLKHKIQKLNISGQKQIIQPVPVVSDCLGHFVPIYCPLSPKDTNTPQETVACDLKALVCPPPLCTQHPAPQKEE